MLLNQSFDYDFDKSIYRVLLLCMLTFFLLPVSQAHDSLTGENEMTTDIQNIGILIFDEVEVLDFAGPYEVFTMARLQPGVESRVAGKPAPFNVFTIAKTTEAIKATGGLSINPDYSFANAPKIDLLLIPGGPGARQMVKDGGSLTLPWIEQLSKQKTQMASVCTGSLILAKLGLLSGKKATTHWAALKLLASMDSSIDVLAERRFVDDDVITSAGISAGIDMSLYIVEKLLGLAIAEDTARVMDYNWSR